jgi:hypothetical protein
LEEDSAGLGEADQEAEERRADGKISMMINTPEKLTENLKETLGSNLKTVALFGSAAAHDRTVKFSDYNVLVVVADMGLEILKKIGPAARQWAKAGNPPPLLFTEAQLRQAEDVFPLEFLDIKSSHTILWGSDPFPALEVHRDHLRHQLEYELRGKLIQLRQRYLETAGKTGEVTELVGKSISTFAALFKGTLRLIGEEPPERRVEVFQSLKKHVQIDEQALLEIWNLREKKHPGQSPDDLFASLLTSVERVADFVNNYKRKETV